MDSSCFLSFHTQEATCFLLQLSGPSAPGQGLAQGWPRLANMFSTSFYRALTWPSPSGSDALTPSEIFPDSLD